MNTFKLAGLALALGIGFGLSSTPNTAEAGGCTAVMGLKGPNALGNCKKACTSSCDPASIPLDACNDACEASYSSTPTPAEVKCWDGSKAKTKGDCPVKPAGDVTCWDGSKAKTKGDCPVKPAGDVTCWDGSKAKTKGDCPVQPITCTAGNLGCACLPDGTCTDPYSCDPATTTCVDASCTEEGPTPCALNLMERALLGPVKLTGTFDQQWFATPDNAGVIATLFGGVENPTSAEAITANKEAGGTVQWVYDHQLVLDQLGMTPETAAEIDKAGGLEVWVKANSGGGDSDHLPLWIAIGALFLGFAGLGYTCYRLNTRLKALESYDPSKATFDASQIVVATQTKKGETHNVTLDALINGEEELPYVVADTIVKNGGLIGGIKQANMAGQTPTAS